MRGYAYGELFTAGKSGIQVMGWWVVCAAAPVTGQFNALVILFKMVLKSVSILLFRYNGRSQEGALKRPSVAQFIPCRAFYSTDY